MNSNLIHKLTKTHMFTATPEVLAICQDLFALTGLSYFTYERIYNDKSHIRLTTHPNWIKHYYEYELFNTAFFERPVTLFHNGFYLWSDLKQFPIYTNAKNYDITNGITITKPQSIYCDFYHFGFPVNYPYLSFYHQQSLDVYYHFINFFHNKFDKIIKQALENRIYIENDYDSLKQSKLLIETLADVKIENKLTDFEFNCLEWLIKGKTQEEIVLITNQPATKIAYSMQKLKNLFNCRTLFQLGLRTGQHSNGAV